MLLLELHQRAQEVARMHKSDALSMHVELVLALPEHPSTFGG